MAHNLICLDEAYCRPSVAVAALREVKSRGNPGSASAACVVQYVQGDQIWILARRALKLGHTTSVHAEFEACFVGIRLLIELFIQWRFCVP